MASCGCRSDLKLINVVAISSLNTRTVENACFIGTELARVSCSALCHASKMIGTSEMRLLIMQNQPRNADNDLWYKLVAEND